MKKTVLDIKGKKVSDIDLSDSVFAIEPNALVISQYVYSYLSNQRQGNAHTKNRAEVSGGGKKPWKQKGTGRARFGSSRVPIWRKGGVAFGPRNTVNHKKHLTKNFKKAALRNILSEICRLDLVHVVDSIKIEKDSQLTKQASTIKDTFAKEQKRFTIITSEKKEQVMNAFANINGVSIITAKDLNGYDLVAGGTILFEKDAIEYINSKLVKEDVSAN